MNNINVKELQKFIEDNANKGLTSQEITKLIMGIKFGILQQAEKAFEQATEERNSAMVAAIAELLKNY
ncbi:hypothetical protein [Enterococcus faecalis]|uniref:hypothetical protein n=1 Tax=Enterococcus faecalis TaxID=1351 RepID=UPI003D102671